MSSAAFNDTIEALHQLEQYLDFSGQLGTAIAQRGNRSSSLEPSACPLLRIDPEPPAPRAQRVLNHCLVYTRTYALLESFVYNRLSSILALLSTGYRYPDLDKTLRDAFRRGTASIINRFDQSRYSSISSTDFVSNFSAALSDKGHYNLDPKAVLYGDGNYRLSEISRLCAICGLADIGDAISANNLVIDFFSSESPENGTVEGYLSGIVSYRNVAVHSAISDISSINILKQTIRFVRVFVTALHHVVQSHLLSKIKQLGWLNNLGRVTENFKSGAAIICIDPGMILKRDDRVVVQKGKNFFFSQVRDMQLDGETVTYARGSNGLEIGAMFTHRIKAGSLCWEIASTVDQSIF